MLPTGCTWLSVDRAAKALGCSADTIRRHIKNGRLTAYKSGPASFSPLRIPESEVIALLEASRVQPRPAPRRPICCAAFVDPQGDILAAPDIPGS